MVYNRMMQLYNGNQRLQRSLLASNQQAGESNNNITDQQGQGEQNDHNTDVPITAVPQNLIQPTDDIEQLITSTVPNTTQLPAGIQQLDVSDQESEENDTDDESSEKSNNIGTEWVLTF